MPVRKAFACVIAVSTTLWSATASGTERIALVMGNLNIHAVELPNGRYFAKAYGQHRIFQLDIVKNYF